MKASEKSSEEGASSQNANLGRQPQPFDFTAVTNFQVSYPYHSTCILTKVNSTTGLGFRDSKQETVDPNGIKPTTIIDVESNADKALDPLCDHSFADVLNDITEDYWQTGNGYLEVVRGGDNEDITGLHQVPSPGVFIFLEDNSGNYHYEVVGEEGAGTDKRFAKFGDKERFIKATNKQGGVMSFQLPDETKNGVSEIIHFRRPTSLNRWYGFPDWLSCVPSIEMVQCLIQYKFDFFYNRGVPEFLLFLTGATVAAPDWTKLTDVLKANIGRGNSHKSGAFNFPGEDIKIQLEKLAMDGSQEDDFGNTKEALSLDIVTAHRVPPLLAGIQIPGKLGSTNELPNALMAFQILAIGPAQRLFQRKLGNTLGNPEVNGGLGLTEKDFYLRKITEEIDIGTMDTVSRMRETVPEAKSKGRDPKDGLKD